MQHVARGEFNTQGRSARDQEDEAHHCREYLGYTRGRYLTSFEEEQSRGRRRTQEHGVRQDVIAAQHMASKLRRMKFLHGRRREA